LSNFDFSVRQSHEGETMSQFLVLIYDNPARWKSVSPDEMHQAMEKYRAWTQKPFTKDAKTARRRSRTGDSVQGWQAAHY
jgi:hypothetical protein